MKDQAVLFYSMNGILYPVALTEQQSQMLQMLVKVFEPLQVVKSHPQGESINLLEANGNETN
ncbi:hypothetical protein BK129_14660 [Paenibacillus amylolyticus]|uniref:hypothetical protein n=1 Tax=Paenibacillus TaxID=44249 RepID=UPI00096CFD62|nr:hypothetical protein [Paenibacillus amylolyticus]OMF05226.1 hypothetical protein BK129_14660 [Paenibacillus amylolyticus]